MELVCDNSELNGVWGAEALDILVIGGYLISRDRVASLLTKVQEVKTAHRLDPHCPVKWNVRDLDRALTAHDLMHDKFLLLHRCDQLRTDLLNALVSWTLYRMKAGSAYLRGATGPLRGARLLVDGDPNSSTSAEDLDRLL